MHRRPAPATDAEPEAQADDQGPEPGFEQEGAHPPGRHHRIGFDGTQRVPRNAPRVLAELLELARRQLLDRLAFGLQPSPQPFGQIVRVGSHVRTALLSVATGRRSWDLEPSGSSCPGVAPPGPPPARLRRHLPGSAPCRARHAGAGSRGSGRAGRARAQGRPAAGPPRRRRGARVAAPELAPGHPAGSSPVRR